MRGIIKFLAEIVEGRTPTFPPQGNISGAHTLLDALRSDVELAMLQLQGPGVQDFVIRDHLLYEDAYMQRRQLKIYHMVKNGHPFHCKPNCKLKINEGSSKIYKQESRILYG